MLSKHNYVYFVYIFSYFFALFILYSHLFIRIYNTVLLFLRLTYQPINQFPDETFCEKLFLADMWQFDKLFYHVQKFPKRTPPFVFYNAKKECLERN